MKKCGEPDSEGDPLTSECYGGYTDGLNIEPPSYATIVGAAQHVFDSALGNTDTDGYQNNPMSIILCLMYLILVIGMTIHLLNMLIAIMGQSFDRNNEVAESNRKIS